MPKLEIRPTVVEINLDAIAHNLLEIRRIVTPGVQIAAVVKADAYGHGAVAVARTLAAEGCHHFGVATIGEARELCASLYRSAAVSSEQHLRAQLRTADGAHPPLGREFGARFGGLPAAAPTSRT